MNLLITGAWQQANRCIKRIEDLGHKVQFLQNENDKLPCEYEWVEGIIGNGVFLTHSIEKFCNLKYIQLTSAGFDRVPINYVNAHKIQLYNARGVYSIPMAEYAVAGVLSLYKSQKFFIENQKEHKWEKKRDLRELAGQTVCILGCGSVGTECAKRFEAFGCLVFGIDIKVGEHENFFCVYHLDNIKEILSKSDIVILTIPLTPETYHIFNNDMFDAMKSDSVIVNIARGALIDTDALINALNVKLAGAVLDVFEDEPLRDSVLWDMDNVIITPHNSFVGSGNQDRLREIILENIKRHE